jgi:hypothetical protein
VSYLKISIIVLLFLLFFYFPGQVFAARNLIISSEKSSLFGDEEITISASSSGFTNGEEIYVKGAFYKDGFTNYFGYTKKENEWVKNGETSTNQKIVKIGEWDNKLSIKSDFLDSGYQGEGSYKLKIGFYYFTSGGNLSSVNWSDNNLEIAINEPDPTSVPTNSPIPAKASNVLEQDEETPAVYSPTPTKIVVVNTRIPLEDLVDSMTASKEAIDEAILGESTLSAEINIVKEKSDERVKVFSSNSNNIGKLLIGIGVVFFTACGIVLGAKKIKIKETLNDK